MSRSVGWISCTQTLPHTAFAGLEQAVDDQTEQKATDMGHVGHPAQLYRGNSQGLTKELCKNNFRTLKTDLRYNLAQNVVGSCSSNWGR